MEARLKIILEEKSSTEVREESLAEIETSSEEENKKTRQKKGGAKRARKDLSPINWDFSSSDSDHEKTGGSKSYSKRKSSTISW